MRVVFLSTSSSHQGGGVFEVLYQLSAELINRKIELSVTWHQDDCALKDKHLWGDTPLLKYHLCNIIPFSWVGYSSDLLYKVTSVNPEVLHLHGIWMYHSYVTKEIKNRNPSVKTIVAPHGMLDHWALKNSGLKKKLVGALYENENLKKANCIQALNISEYKSIRAYGLKNPVAIIPNGITLPKDVIYTRGKDNKTLLFIGRIHPKKGIAEMLDGLKIVRDKYPELVSKWRVRIAGWDQLGHTDYLKKKCAALGMDDMVSFIGPVLGDVKSQELCAADAYVLASFSEGLPMSVLEAWSYKLPVVMTDQCNLPDGFEQNAAIRVTTEPQSIAEGFESLFRMNDAQRTSMGNNGYLLVERNYTWAGIADKTIQLYNWLLNGGEKPEFVYIS